MVLKSGLALANLFVPPASGGRLLPSFMP